MNNTGYTHIIDAHALHQNLTNQSWVIIDCRFDLADPDWGFQDYKLGHIPDAVYAHLDHDLSGPRTASNGRHPLPDFTIFRETLGRLGVNSTKQVVAYDTAGGSFAARLWWMLKYYGHPHVAVLNGGFQAWTAGNYPVEIGSRTNQRTIFTGEPDPSILTTTAEMEVLSRTGQVTLIDARAPERFRGEVEPLDPVAGHIPGAVNRFHQDNLGSDGLFLPTEILKSEFLSLLNQSPPGQSVVYCGSGVTSCHHLLSMQAAGLPMARLYAGSWSEWIRDPQRPIATGENL